MTKLICIILTVILFSYTLIEQGHAKEIISTADKQFVYERYSKTKRWQIVAARKVDKEYAASCRIYAASNAYHFNLRYTGSLGWALSVTNLQAQQYLYKPRPVSIYVDNKLIGKKKPENHTGNISSFIFGLDTKYLNPIIKGSQLHLVQGDQEVPIRLKGLKNAYKRALDCWKDRMNSIAYDAKNSTPQYVDQLKKDIEFSSYAHKQIILSQTKLAAHIVIEHFGRKGLKIVKGEKEYLEYQIIQNQVNGKSRYLGSLWQVQNNGQRASIRKVNTVMEAAVAETVKHCEKTAVEKHRPFFTTNNIEVHSISFACGTNTGQVTEHSMITMQNKEKILNIYFGLPEDLSNLDDAKFKEIAEAVSRKVF